MNGNFLGAISNPERGILPRLIREKLFDRLVENIENGAGKQAIRAAYAIVKIAVKNPDSRKLAEAIPVFAKGLGHSEAKLSYCCQRALVMIGEKSAPALTEAIKSENKEKQKLAIVALGHIRSISSLETLVEVIEKNPQHGWEASTGIGHIAEANPGASGLIAAAERCTGLTYSGNVMVRKNATTALGKIGWPGNLGRLVELMDEDDYMVRMEAAIAISGIFERHVWAEKSPGLIAALKKGMVDENSGVMLNSMHAISRSGIEISSRERLDLIWEAAEKIRKKKGKEAIHAFKNQYLRELEKMREDAKKHVAKKGAGPSTGKPVKQMRRVVA
jgi:HEAT repeat protein